MQYYNCPYLQEMNLKLKNGFSTDSFIKMAFKIYHKGPKIGMSKREKEHFLQYCLIHKAEIFLYKFVNVTPFLFKIEYMRKAIATENILKWKCGVIQL